MANPQIKQTNKQVDPSLSDLLNLWAKQIKLDINCHAIATIQSFNPQKQTCTATINYTKTFFQKTGTNNPEPIQRDYPQLLDIPVIILGGGTYRLTFPVQAGDNCLILFNDRDMDNWFQSGQKAPVASGRLHAFSDAVALVGLYPSSNPLTPYDTTRAKLANGETMVGVGETLIKIANATTTLNTLLGTLIDTINAITTTNTVPGAPAALSVASIAALTAVKAQIAGLLE